MAEAAEQAQPGWSAIEVRGTRALKGVELENGGADLCVVVWAAPARGAEESELEVVIRSGQKPGRERIHYRSTVRLSRALPAALARPAAPTSYGSTRVTPSQAYDEWLIHGPSLQMIEELEELSLLGARARVRSSKPGEWVAGRSGAWSFDPALLDAAAQMAWIWSRAVRGETALPAAFARVVRCAGGLPERLAMEFTVVDREDPHLVRADVSFSDAEGRVLLRIEGLESVSSAALNRLGATPHELSEGRA
jgi:hypothetical protein